MNKLNHKELQSKITVVLSENLFNTSFHNTLENYYECIYNNFEFENEDRLILNNVLFKELNLFSNIAQQKVNLSNCGIDFPILLGNTNSFQKKIMIVAMDPKRNAQHHDEISLSTVFSLHNKNDRNTKKNDYWRFIEPLTKSNLVYITDVYKLYYEYQEQNKTLLSNKDKSFTGNNSEYYALHKFILNEEIKIIQPDMIITLGIESANALKSIQNIQSKEILETINNITYLFMPHISRTVTQNIQTIANLFISIGLLKNNNEMNELGKKIQHFKKQLFI